MVLCTEPHDVAEVDLACFGFSEIAKLGKGHTAKALLVREDATARLFVAKCVLLSVLTEHTADLAEQEVILLQSMSNPYIVVYHDSFIVESARTLVILMEYCDGGDLRRLIRDKAKAGARFTEDQIMMLFVQIVLALHYIHSEKVLHRDIKASNIFLNKEAKLIKLGDFGTSRILESTLDNAATLVGTPYYMSPEVCKNEEYSWKSDVWSLGCVLYELCTLRHPFDGPSLLDIGRKICNEPCEPISDTYSQALRELVHQMLDKSAAARPSTLDLLSNPHVKLHLEMLAAANSSAARATTPPGTPPVYALPGKISRNRLPPLCPTQFRDTVEFQYIEQATPKSVLFETCMEHDPSTIAALFKGAVALD